MGNWQALCLSQHRPKDCRAYPDEKGIETVACEGVAGDRAYDCRAYPDEKGIETDSGGLILEEEGQLQSLSR